MQQWTVVDTFALYHYKDITWHWQAGITATEAVKCQKYEDLLDNYHFQPVTIQSTGVYMVSSLLLFWAVSQETCWQVWWPQGATVVRPALVPSCGHTECCQHIHIGLCGLTWFWLSAVEIDRYGFFEADTDIIFTKFLNRVFCFIDYQKYYVFYVLPFFQNLKNQDL